MKILLLAAGRRYSFVERLIAAGFEVHSVETDKNCPIKDICSVIYDESYRSISSYMIKHDIKHILPMNDYWSSFPDDRLRQKFQVIGSHINYSGSTCYNKAYLHDFVSKLRWMKGYYPFVDILSPAILKPKIGNSSNGVVKIPWYSPKKIRVPKDMIVQRFCTGTEYSVDAYFNKYGHYINGLARSRDRVAGGEVVNSTTLRNSLLTGICRDLGNSLRLVGPVCFQFIGSDLIEINARFGGGCILSLEAGFDMIQIIKEEYFLDQSINHWSDKKFKCGLQMRRVFRETFR